MSLVTAPPVLFKIVTATLDKVSLAVLFNEKRNSGISKLLAGACIPPEGINSYGPLATTAASAILVNKNEPPTDQKMVLTIVTIETKRLKRDINKKD